MKRILMFDTIMFGFQPLVFEGCKPILIGRLNDPDLEDQMIPQILLLFEWFESEPTVQLLG